MKLNKEKRELKLELQRSQTEGREIRAELREKDLMIKESDIKIEALEKAVESQLDKVDDLEDELRKANEEIFTLEDRLNHMQAVLDENELNGEANGVGVSKEKDFEARRQERLERRLEEKEKELEERERKLRKGLINGTGKDKEVEQLELDNRMLLKALDREKNEANALAMAKDEEIERLKSKIGKINAGDEYSESADNERLIEQLETEKANATSALKKKDDALAKMEYELRKLKLHLSITGGGNDSEIQRDLEAAKAEAEVLKSRFEGAQRQNRLLEDDIEHWKSVNCDLEDELTEWKGRAAKYREKAEGNRLGQSSSRLLNGVDEEQPLDSQRSISTLWSAMTRPQKRPSRESSDKDDFISRSTFH